MDNVIVFAAALYGALIGSFLNVCIFRLPRRCLRIWKPKLSFCPACHASLGWKELLPLASYLLLAGRCRSCRVQIPVRYFLVELATTLFFVGIAERHLVGVEERAWVQAAIELLLGCSLLVCALTDWDHMIIPDEIDIPGFLVAPFLVAAAPALISEPPAWASEPHLRAALASAFGAAIGGGVIFLVGWGGTKIFKKDAISLGDVKLLAMIGGFTGWQGAVASLVTGAMTGAAYGVVRRLTVGDHVLPFGPFLALGAALYAFVPPFRAYTLDMLEATVRALGMISGK